MPSTKAIEYRITRKLARRRFEAAPARAMPLAQNLICSVALAGAMLTLGSWMPELLGALLGGGILAALGAQS